MSKTQKKILLIVFSTLTFFSLLAYIAFKPEVVITNYTVNLALDHFPSRFKISRESLSFELNSVSFYKKNFKISAKNLCSKGNLIPFSGCFSFSSKGQIDLKNLKTSLDFINLEESSISLPKDKEESPLIFSSFYSFDFLTLIDDWVSIKAGSISSLKIEDLNISAKNFSLIKKELTVSNFTLKSSENSFSLQVPSGMISPNQSKASGFLSLKEYGKIEISIDINVSKGIISVKTKEQPTPAKLFLDLQPQRISGYLYGSIKNRPPLLNPKINNCSFSLNLESEKILIKNTCSLETALDSSSFKLNLKNPKINFTTDTEGFFSLQNGSFYLRTSALSDELLTNKLKINSTANFELSSKLLEENVLNINFETEVSSENFQDIVSIFSKTEYAIPAPFNALKGPSNASISGSFNPLNYKGEIPLAISTKLKSKNQIFELSGAGTFFTAKTNRKIEASLFLNKSQIILPDIKIKDQEKNLDIPLSKDSRFLTKQTKFEKSPVDYDLNIKTINPLLVISNLTKSKIPIDFNISLTPEESSGFVGVNNFSIDLFKRKAQIKKLDFKVKNPKEIEIDGLIEVEYADYTIFITVYGDAKSPQFVFESTPFLPEKSVISVLLFGSPMDEADSDQTEATSEFQSAAAQGALGLTSLIIFASTPIESFNYDPQSEKISAKLRVNKKTSLIYGQGSSDSQYGVRQKIGPNLFIETFYNNSEDGESSTSGFINWSKRY